MNFKTFLEMVNKSDIPAYLRKNDKMTTKDLEKERTKNRSHPETIKKINGTVQEEVLDESTKYVVHYTDSKGNHVNSSKAFDDKAKADAHASKGNAMDKVGGKYTVKSMQNEAKKEDPPFDGPYTKTPATTKDKSGAVHTAMSRAKHLAKQAMKNVKEEVEQIDELSKKTVDDYKTMVAIRTVSAIQKGETEIPKSKQRIAGLKRANTRLAKEEVVDEQAPVAPVPDKKYIKGTPEHKAYKATKKPINGMPTNVKEALKGDQHKIDKNKNGKIDAHDFKLLRKEETVQEKLNVGGDTPRKVTTASGGTIVTNNASPAKKPAVSAAPAKPQSALEKLRARMSTSKSVKEAAMTTAERDAKFKADADKYDSDRKAYVAKHGEAATRQNTDLPPSHPKSAESLAKKKMKEEIEIDEAMNRQQRERAADEQARRERVLQNNPRIAAEVERRRKAAEDAKKKQTNEQVEELDELSKGTLGSYIKKASNDLANKGAALGKKQADADEVDRYTNRHMPNQSDERERMRKAVGASHDDINKVRSGAIKRNKNIGKAVDRLSKEEFENGELETMSKSYKQFVESLNEIKMSDLPSRKVSGSSYGAQYHDDEGDDEEEKPKAKPADAVKRGRGRPAGSKSGARQGGSAVKSKNGADYTGYKLHLPNKN